jgi:hypothetical protein
MYKIFEMTKNPFLIPKKMADGGELDYLNVALEKGLISESEYLSLQNSKEPNSIYRPLSGKISAKATISYDVAKEEFDQFVNYVYDVYEEEGYNKSQVRVAVRKYLKDLEGEFTWGGGDSLDRERVYEYLKNPKQKGIVNPFLADGGMMAKGGKLKSALMRDRAYKSNEPHEQAYTRKTRPKNPKYNYGFFEDGGSTEMHRAYAMGGVLQHGLESGDFIVSHDEGKMVVMNGGSKYEVNIHSGSRTKID